MLLYLVLAALGLWFLLWPNVARHTFIWPWRPARPIVVRLVGLFWLSILAWLVFVQAD